MPHSLIALLMSPVGSRQHAPELCGGDEQREAAIATLEPYDAINALETSLRDLVRIVWGDDWIAKSGIDVDPIKWQPKVEAKKRPAVEHHPDLLNYTEFSQLMSMITDHWNDDFKGVFPDQPTIETYIRKLKPLRNAVSHARPIAPLERDLISGMAGEIINLVTKYRSRRGGDVEYWPIITAARDSFGHDDTQIGPRPGAYQVLTHKELIVGQPVQFHLEAVDPEGRDLSWRLTVDRPGRGAYRQLGTMTGDVIDFEWIVEHNDIGEMTAVGMAVTSSADHHRHGTYDDHRLFWYKVLPSR